MWNPVTRVQSIPSRVASSSRNGSWERPDANITLAVPRAWMIAVIAAAAASAASRARVSMLSSMTMVQASGPVTRTAGARRRSRRAADRSSQRDRDFDLDGTPAWECGDTDGGTRVPSGVAEHVTQKTTRAVDDCGLLEKVRGARDEPEDGEDPLDPVEAAELRGEHGESVQRAP